MKMLLSNKLIQVNSEWGYVTYDRGYLLHRRSRNLLFC